MAQDKKYKKDKEIVFEFDCHTKGKSWFYTHLSASAWVSVNYVLIVELTLNLNCAEARVNGVLHVVAWIIMQIKL